jgi:2,5-diamino-6-(ribosylamino)-4(3H)-pyrimidinone 5'-phosphate reductase
MDKPITTLFMLTSLDGKISTGSNNSLDFDSDFPKIKGLKEGLKQYYDIEQKTDLFSFNSGKVQAKIGINKKNDTISKTPVSFLVVDNKPHLNKIGMTNLLKKSKKLFIITTNKKHPAFNFKNVDNLEIIYYSRKIDFVDLFLKFKQLYNIKSMTIQTGSELNSTLLRLGLIDKVSIVISPALIGGKDTSSLIGGDSIDSIDKLKLIKTLKLIDVIKLKHSYIQLKYKVNN